MSDLDTYLARHFLTADQFATVCKLSVDELDDLIDRNLLPAPSYTVSVSDSCTVCSFVFGEMEAQGSTAGRYFHPANVTWVEVARGIVAKHGPQRAEEKLRERFGQNFQSALMELNTTTLRLRDSFTDDGTLIAAGLRVRTEIIWEHFLEGTFGLCVANPISEAAIARKEVLQEKLSQLSDKGTRAVYSQPEARDILLLVNAFAEASMPFSPIEYHLSSRRQLVNDLRTRLESCLQRA